MALFYKEHVVGNSHHWPRFARPIEVRAETLDVERLEIPLGIVV